MQTIGFAAEAVVGKDIGSDCSQLARGKIDFVVVGMGTNFDMDTVMSREQKHHC
jgi:hypothetical protein